jgi:glycosyltransferase involved in cell wall biosynthesis
MTKYGLTSKHLLVKFAKFFEQFIIRFSDFSLTVTKALRKRYIESGADPKKVFVVSNAIDETDFNIDISTFIRDKKVSDFLLVTHGTIEERYGHEIVIRAVNKLKTKYPDLKFIITGDGSYTPKLKKLVKELDCKNNVKFLGYLPFDQLLETLANSDAGIISMYSTPYSELIDTNKMYEYFNLDLPVLVPKLNPITETFNTSEVIFFEPGEPDDLALKIEELILNPGDKISLIKNARLKYDKLKWDVEKKSFLKLFMQN